MTDRKPEVWRGHYMLWPEGEEVCKVGKPEDGLMANCTVIEDGAVMPLDAATERLVEAVRHAPLEHSQLCSEMTGADFCDCRAGELPRYLAAFDAARKENQ